MYSIKLFRSWVSGVFFIFELPSRANIWDERILGTFAVSASVSTFLFGDVTPSKTKKYTQSFEYIIRSVVCVGVCPVTQEARPLHDMIWSCNISTRREVVKFRWDTQNTQTLPYWEYWEYMGWKGRERQCGNGPHTSVLIEIDNLETSTRKFC